MKKIEANTLEEAYAKAANTFDCSVTDLDYEIVQHPSSGFLGFGAKKAIIIAACKTSHTGVLKPSQAPEATTQPTSILAPKEPALHDVTPDTPLTPSATKEPNRESANTTTRSEAAILDGFFDDAPQKASQDDVPAPTPTQDSAPRTDLSEAELSRAIENQLTELMRSICFDIDTVEVDVIDGTAYIFIDGEDAALLIGKEGYRYNALSYLLYNWIHNEYDLYVKHEIAQFLASQQEMIRNYIQPVIEHVHQLGWGKTRPLNGILVQIALEQLREEFPNKYVAIKRTRQGERYILINEFNKRS